jgi:hypothetical protein
MAEIDFGLWGGNRIAGHSDADAGEQAGGQIERNERADTTHGQTSSGLAHSTRVVPVPGTAGEPIYWRAREKTSGDCPFVAATARWSAEVQLL